MPNWQVCDRLTQIVSHGYVLMGWDAAEVATATEIIRDFGKFSHFFAAVRTISCTIVTCEFSLGDPQACGAGGSVKPD
jgi:hypothetical protein